MRKQVMAFLHNFSLRSLKAAAGTVFNLDYELTHSLMPVFGTLGTFAFIVFHFTEKMMGFTDHLPSRLACIALGLAILAWPRDGRWRRLRLVHWELSVGFMLPVSQTLLFLINPIDPYWNSSNIFWAFFLGFASKGLWLPFHLVLGQYGGYLLCLWIQGGLSPEKLHVLMDQQPSICFSAFGGLGIKIALEIFHRRGLALAGVTARALEAESREAEIGAAYAELQRREEVIKRFVRPSLFEELKAGLNPIEFKPVQRELAVMFCDIRDFTHLTEVLSAEEKSAFLNQYFSLMTGPIIANGGEVDKIMGDCVMGLFPDGRKAVKAAVEMRLRLQDFNREMYAQGKPKIRNGIGIAKGPVMMGNFGSFEKLDRTVIGEAVNIASRLESKTKMYNLEVVVTEGIIADLEVGAPHYRWIDMVQVKGSSRHLKLYEIYGHQPDEVRGYKDATREMLEKALAIYFRKGFKDATRLFRAMLEQVPPHRHAASDLMDNILNYYLAHCEAWNEDATGAWQKIERWEGVHVFYEK
ncbi:MAG: family 3 adenylate cyclase [Fibrobacteres bacterium]|nr:family 3 adenylate cyclase [Fibrobacterota bacterium]